MLQLSFDLTEHFHCRILHILMNLLQKLNTRTTTITISTRIITVTIKEITLKSLPSYSLVRFSFWIIQSSTTAKFSSNISLYTTCLLFRAHLDRERFVKLFWFSCCYCTISFKICTVFIKKKWMKCINYRTFRIMMKYRLQHLTFIQSVSKLYMRAVAASA